MGHLPVGATAAVGAQAALLRARRTRQGDLLDVGAMEAAAACHQWSTVLYTHSGVLKQRWGNRLGEAHHPMNLYRCSDGWVVIGAVSREQWEGLCIATDGVEFLAEEALYVPAIRFDRSEEIDAIIDPWCAGLTTAEVVTALQENRCPAARVLTLQETLRDPQLEARGFWVTAEQAAKNTKMPGVPFRIGGYETPFRPAPALGEHQNEVVA